MSSSTSHPLPAYPEFSLIEHSGCREYRLQNRVLVSRSNTATAFSLRYMTVILCFFTVFRILSGVWFYTVAGVGAIVITKTQLLNVIYESVILLPPHGIQLETHRGLYFLKPLFSSRRFIPSTKLDGVIINEGLSGWNVYYYLALVKHSQSRTCELEIVFQHLLPPHSILLQIFEGIHEIVLFNTIAKTESI